MSPFVYTVFLHPSNQQPDCRLASSKTPDIRMNFFFSRAAYRLFQVAEQLWGKYQRETKLKK